MPQPVISPQNSTGITQFYTRVLHKVLYLWHEHPWCLTKQCWGAFRVLVHLLNLVNASWPLIKCICLVNLMLSVQTKAFAVSLSWYDPAPLNKAVLFPSFGKPPAFPWDYLAWAFKHSLLFSQEPKKGVAKSYPFIALSYAELDSLTPSPTQHKCVMNKSQM